MARMIGDVRSAVIVVAISLALAACSNVELQKNGTGTDEMLPSPCACVQIPYSAPTFRWRT